MGSTPRRDETRAALRPAEDPISVEPWDFWERPFIHRTDQLDTFVLFLAAEATREWEIHQMTVEAVTLRLTDSQSELFYTVQAGELRSEEARRLWWMLERLPREMPNLAKKKLARYVEKFLRGQYREL
jgi:hypothetical protein